jgi:hypothetical protein
MTVADHQKFYSEVWAEYPGQSHFSDAPLARAIESMSPKTVMEVGGWDGEAAVTMLERFDFIEKWTNVEICREAVEHGRQHPRYKSFSPNKWYWECEWPPVDMFVGVHVIEHMRARDLAALVDATDAKAFYFEAPLTWTPINWTGVSATHILEFGFEGVSGLMHDRGYVIGSAERLVTKPESGGFSQAYLYLRRSEGVD